jgi:hypothetical protein
MEADGPRKPPGPGDSQGNEDMTNTACTPVADKDLPSAIQRVILLIVAIVGCLLTVASCSAPTGSRESDSSNDGRHSIDETREIHRALLVSECVAILRDCTVFNATLFDPTSLRGNHQHQVSPSCLNIPPFSSK